MKELEVVILDNRSEIEVRNIKIRISGSCRIINISHNKKYNSINCSIKALNRKLITYVDNGVEKTFKSKIRPTCNSVVFR